MILSTERSLLEFRNIPEKIVVGDGGVFEAKPMTISKFNTVSGTNIKRVEKNPYDFIPSVVEENIATDFEKGRPDVVEDMEYWLNQLDITTQKIEDLIIFETTTVNVYKDAGATANTIMEDNERQNIRAKFADGIRFVEYNDTYVNGQEFQVNIQNPEFGKLIDLWNYYWEKLLDWVGIRYSYNKKGSFQETDTQEVNKGDSSSQVAELKKMMREQGLKDLFNILIKTDKVLKNLPIEEIQINLIIKDIRKEQAIIADPVKFLQMGYSMAELYAEVKGIDIDEAKEKIDENIEEFKKNPMWYALFYKNIDGAPWLEGDTFVDDKAKELFFEQQEKQVPSVKDEGGGGNR